MREGSKILPPLRVNHERSAMGSASGSVALEEEVERGLEMKGEEGEVERKRIENWRWSGDQLANQDDCG